MFAAEVVQVFSHRTFPDGAPLHRTPPKLSELQMVIHHMAMKGADTEFASLWAKALHAIGVCFLQTFTALVGGPPCQAGIYAWWRIQPMANDAGVR